MQTQDLQGEVCPKLSCRGAFSEFSLNKICKIIDIQFIFCIVLRDIEDRGRDLEHVLHQYTTLVKPAFEEFCLPVS